MRLRRALVPSAARQRSFSDGAPQGASGRGAGHGADNVPVPQMTPPGPDDAQSPTPMNDDSSLPRIRAIVVDDQADQRQVVEFMLLARGFDVAATVSDGAEALRAVEDVDPDVVVSDYQMPRVSGLELVQALRDDPGRRDLPVVIVTGADDSGVALLRDMAGVAVLSKPVVVTELADAVETLLASGSRREIADPMPA